jgi:hypothetical protein
MEDANEASVHRALGRLQESLIEEMKNDLSCHTMFSERGLLKKHQSLICRPRPYIVGTAPEIKLSAQGGEYFPQVTYDKRFQRKFLSIFMSRDSEVQNTLGIIAKNSEENKGAKLLAELYLIPFCNTLMEEFLKEGSLEKERLDNLACQFIRDLSEGGLRILLRIDLDGIAVAEDFSLKPNNEEEVLIRQPKLEDLSEPVVVVEQWDGDYDYATIPQFPNISSVVELELKSLNFEPMGTWIADPRIYDAIRTVDWLANGTVPRAGELRDVLSLFQSKAYPFFQSLTLSLVLRNLSKEGGRYEVIIPTRPSYITNRKQFVIFAENKGKLKMFWESMSKVGMTERIYGPIDKEDSIGLHVARPTEIAFKRYLEILDSWKDEKVMIHETVEALEGFFTPEKWTGKAFILRVTRLMKLLNIDPNDTYYRLGEGWRIRSDYSHRALGWDEAEFSRCAKDNAEEIRSIRAGLERDFQTELAKLLLNYLRISIIARTLSGVSDTDFIRLLDTSEGQEKLRLQLSGLDYLAGGDPLKPVQSAKRERCPYCGEAVPHFAMDFHKYYECKKARTLDK